MNETITITGNVATDPDPKSTSTGLAITTFRVASTQRRYDRQKGAWVDADTNWYTVSTYRALAEHAAASLRKGDRVILTGRLRLREWEANGKRGLAVEVDADAIGHDLLWGTTTFTRTAAPPRAAEPERAGSEEPPNDEGGGWSVVQPGERAQVGDAEQTPF